MRGGGSIECEGSLPASPLESKGGSRPCLRKREYGPQPQRERGRGPRHSSGRIPNDKGRPMEPGDQDNGTPQGQRAEQPWGSAPREVLRCRKRPETVPDSSGGQNHHLQTTMRRRAPPGDCCRGSLPGKFTRKEWYCEGPSRRRPGYSDRLHKRHVGAERSTCRPTRRRSTERDKTYQGPGSTGRTTGSFESRPKDAGRPLRQSRSTGKSWCTRG